ncbi:hypothetical protein C4901_11245 [Acidiferrobacter sp. SPIII_3]|jgi:hypothetical protein|nr:hypothetical protein C4901_11245 [Acidiferrobacter sp. SPIII_3]
MRELSTCPFCADTRTMSTAAGSRGAFKTAGRKGLTSDTRGPLAALVKRLRRYLRSEAVAPTRLG